MCVMFYYCQVPALQLCNYTKAQLQEPSLSVLANMCLSIPVSTASVEENFPNQT